MIPVVNYAKFMKKISIGAIIIITALGLFFAANFFLPSNKPSVKPTPAPAASVYKGNQPCADCPGIAETLTLNDDQSYTDTLVYQDKDTTTVIKGVWVKTTGMPKDTQASVLELSPETGSKSYYKVKEDKLYPLDENKEEINAPFDLSLTKQ